MVPGVNPDFAVVVLALEIAGKISASQATPGERTL
jgi:hypothetical protein